MRGVIKGGVLCLLLAACTTAPRAPQLLPSLRLPQTLHIQRDDGQDWLLVIQQEDEHLRFSLFDPLGVPLARQQWSGGQWRNDGLLPPNREAREVFGALIQALRQAQDERVPAVTLHPGNGRHYQLTPVETP